MLLLEHCIIMEVPSGESVAANNKDGIPNGSVESRTKKLSYSKWRNELKKEKRRTKRKTLAQLRDASEQQNEDNWTVSDNDLNEEEERQRQLENKQWLEREREAQAKFLAKKDREEKEKQLQEEEQRKIKEAWAEEQKKRKEAEEAKEKNYKEKIKEDVNQLHQKKNDVWHNPPAPPGYSAESQELKVCPFFRKVGACRFGINCKRTHTVPETSSTLLFPGMFAHFELEQSFRDEFDSDLTLEYEEGDIYDEFKVFYEDVLPEFEAVGHVTRFVVCCNYEPHLRGNVYVQYASRDEALAAFEKFNGRWYSKRQLSCQFTTVDNWKSAICGLFHHKKCPKGKNCNFLHVFHNPVTSDSKSNRDSRRSRSRGSNRWFERSKYSPGSHRANGASHRNSSKRSRSRTHSVYRRSQFSHGSRRSTSKSSSGSPQSHRSTSKSSLASQRNNRHSTSKSFSRQSRRSTSKSPHLSHLPVSKSPGSHRKHHRSVSKSPSESHRKHHRSVSKSPSESHRKHRRSASKSPSESHRKHHRSKSHRHHDSESSRLPGDQTRKSSKNSQTTEVPNHSFNFDSDSETTGNNLQASEVRSGRSNLELESDNKQQDRKPCQDGMDRHFVSTDSDTDSVPSLSTRISTSNRLEKQRSTVSSSVRKVERDLVCKDKISEDLSEEELGRKEGKRRKKSKKKRLSDSSEEPRRKSHKKSSRKDSE